MQFSFAWKKNPFLIQTHSVSTNTICMWSTKMPPFENWSHHTSPGPSNHTTEEKQCGAESALNQCPFWEWSASFHVSTWGRGSSLLLLLTGQFQASAMKNRTSSIPCYACFWCQVAEIRTSCQAAQTAHIGQSSRSLYRCCSKTDAWTPSVWWALP